MGIGYVYWIHKKDDTDIKISGYVGVSKNYKKRWQEHKTLAEQGLHINKLLANSIAKYNDSLIWELIFKGPYEGCLHIEEYYRPDTMIGWNIAKGGTVSQMLGYRHTIVAKEKMSNSLKTYFSENPDRIDKIRAKCQGNTYRLGKTHTPETCAKISQRVKNAYIESPELLVNLRKRAIENPPMQGKQHSKETKEKMSQSAHRTKKVQCVETGVIYKSVTEAYKAIGLKTHTPLALAARTGCKTKGLHWKYI